MSDYILEMIIAFLLLGMAVLGIHDWMLQYKLHQATTLVTSYQTQIAGLETDAMEAQQRVKDAESRATTQLQKDKESTALIIAENVPHDCPDAVAWAIKQAKSM